MLSYMFNILKQDECSIGNHHFYNNICSSNSIFFKNENFNLLNISRFNFYSIIIWGNSCKQARTTRVLKISYILGQYVDSQEMLNME